MDLKGIMDLKNAFSQIENDLMFLRHRASDENNGMSNEITSAISFIRQSENYIEKNTIINDLQSSSDNSTFSNIGETEILWRCYKEILQQIFPFLYGINGLSSDLNKIQFNGDYDVAQNSYIQNKVYLPLQQNISGNNWSQLCNPINSENFAIMSSGNHINNISENSKSIFRNNIYTPNKVNANVTELFSMHGAGDSVTIRRAKLPPQPEKDIEEIQQTISMQLKLQQHHSKNRYKFQPTHRAWPITPEINVVFQGNSSTNQYPIQNQLFSTTSEPQIYTPSTLVSLHTQYQSQPSHASQLLNQSIGGSNNTFYGFNNVYASSLTNAAILQPNDSDFAQLPSSMFGFLNNTTTNRVNNCNMNISNSTNNNINISFDHSDSSEITTNPNSNYIINGNYVSKSFENQGSSKVSDSKSNMINYQIKGSTLTWEDLANVAITSTN